MKQPFTTLRFASLFALGMNVAPVYGADWYAAATACTPYPEAVAGRQYSNANGRLRFNPNVTGTMYFACNVGSSSALRNSSGQLPGSLYLSITFQIDSNGTITDAQTTAQLKGVNKTTGNISNIALSGFTPPNQVNNGLITRSSPPFNGQNLDFNNNYYYVIITLSRQTTALNPIVYGVGITDKELSINTKKQQ